jgi:PAS domain S-box-containing protein
MSMSPGQRETTRGHDSEVSTILVAARAVLENRRFTDAARSILALTRETLGAEAGFVALRTKEGGDFEVTLVDPEIDDRKPAASLPGSLDRLVARSSKTGRATYSNVLPGNPVTTFPHPGMPFATNALLAPVVLDDGVEGFLCVMNKAPGFAADDSRRAEVFAELAAVALRNSRAVNGLERSRRALEMEAHESAAHLLQSEGTFRTLVENLPDIIARFDTNLRHIYVSPTINLVTGRPAEEFLGRTNRESGIPTDVTRRWDAALQRVLATGQPETLEFEFPGPAETRYFDCRIVPERGPGGAIESVLSVARDVTDRWLAHEAEGRARAVADALRETTVLLNRSLDRESVLSTLLDCLRRLVPFDRARVMLLEHESRVSVRAIFDGDRVIPQTPEARTEFDSTEHPIVRSILMNGTPVLIPDVRNHPDWSLPTDQTLEISWMGIPLFARGNVAGLFSLSKGEPDFFKEEHLRLAEAMASQASAAVENSVLFEQMQNSTLRMKALSRRLVDVQEEERRHIARELHDEAGQALVSLRYGLRLLEREIDRGGKVTDKVADLVQRTDAVIDSLHRLAADLRPAILTHLGLEAVLRQYSRSIGAETGLDIHFKARGFSGERFSPGLETTIYRVVQEAMANIVRHAHATRVDILAEHVGGRIVAVVEDDGVGFDPALVEHGNHFGLIGMEERVAALGGTLVVESRPGNGTTIVAEVPLDNPSSDR